MTRNIAFLLIVVVLSFPFWAGFNILQQRVETSIYESQLYLNPPEVFAESEFTPNQNQHGSGFTAQVANHLSEPEPAAEPLELPDYYSRLQGYKIQAGSALSVKISNGRVTKIIFQKNSHKKLGIASLTKLMTALVAVEFYKETEKIEISKQAVAQLENIGSLKQGEIMRLDDLLHIMLIESSNDAAYALTEPTGVDGFVGLMNLKAKDLQLTETRFYNPIGLDPDDLSRPYDEINYSTARDLATLAQYLLDRHPEILEISNKKEYRLYQEDGSFHHTLPNTNALLYELNNVVGGKTGLTDRAGGCLLLVLEGESPESYYINVILESPERFQDMRKLITYSFEQAKTY